MNRLAYLLILAAILPLHAQQAARLWTNQQGRTVNASLVEVSGGNVVLQLENGTRSSVPASTLSPVDQDYLQKAQAPNTASGPSTSDAALEWPKQPITIDAKALTVTEGAQNDAARRYHYTTGSFEFICTAPLANTVMSEVAADFELVKKAFQAMPWGFEPKPSKSPFFQMYLTESDADYIALGGDDRSASTTSNDGKSLIRFRTLGLKKVGARYQYDARQKDPGQVTNMVVHVLTEDYARIFYPWSRLALEQFVRNVAYQSNGTLKFTDLDSALKKEIKFRATAGALPNLPRMIKYLRQTYIEPNAAAVQLQHEQRLDGQLLMYFFAYLDGDGKGTAWHQYCRDVFAAPAVLRNADNYARGLQLLNKLIGSRDDAKLSSDVAEKLKIIGIKLGAG